MNVENGYLIRRKYIMKKQSAVGLFFSMFLRAAVIILAIVIVVFGAMFMMKLLNGDGGSSSEPATTVGENVLIEPEVNDDLLTAETTAATVEEPEVAAATSYDRNILVLNSTDVSGLAGRWCEKLNGYGYANTTASDYSELQEITKVIAVEDGVGQDLVGYFNGASYEVGTVSSGTSVSTDGYDIVVIIGTADNDQ
jgi:hypothetical protein